MTFGQDRWIFSLQQLLLAKGERRVDAQVQTLWIPPGDAVPFLELVESRANGVDLARQIRRTVQNRVTSERWIAG